MKNHSQPLNESSHVSRERQPGGPGSRPGHSGPPSASAARSAGRPTERPVERPAGKPVERKAETARASAVRSGTPSPAPTGISVQDLAQASTTTKKEIIDRIAADTRQKRSAVKRTVQAFLDTVIDELSVGNRLELRDFGVFEIRERAARTAQNPKTLERVAVPARKTVKFKVGRLMKESVEEQERPEAPKGSKSPRV